MLCNTTDEEEEGVPLLISASGSVSSCQPVKDTEESQEGISFIWKSWSARKLSSPSASRLKQKLSDSLDR
eukprot:212212-Prorocentrum_minimum.AAC.1